VTAERSYFLGTHDEELERLGIQHRVWKPTVLECWRRAGIGPGSKVLDVGAGPGFAAADLAEIVGPGGRVVAVERSSRFVEAGRRMLAGRGHANVEYHELDLMTDPLPAGGMDASWCRWVACFVSSPALLLDKLAAVIRPGGVAIFHEYIHYDTLRIRPGGARTLSQSIALAVPCIAAIYILGTRSVLAFVPSADVDLVYPAAQTFATALRPFALSTAGAVILLLVARDLAQASQVFSAITRLPLVAGWDELLPPWFTRLHPTRKTPVNSILVAGAKPVV
jgi:SAM-dependent methyltransferase